MDNPVKLSVTKIRRSTIKGYLRYEKTDENGVIRGFEFEINLGIPLEHVEDRINYTHMDLQYNEDERTFVLIQDLMVQIRTGTKDLLIKLP